MVWMHRTVGELYGIKVQGGGVLRHDAAVQARLATGWLYRHGEAWGGCTDMVRHGAAAQAR